MINLPEGAQVVPPKVSEVENQFKFCDVQRENLNSKIELLETRLSSVLRKISKGEDSCEKDSELTPLAEGIRKIGKDMEFFVERIQNILERLEI